MTTTASESEQRIAIWSLSPQTIGAYFAIFLIQYIPGVVFKAYTLIQWRDAGDAFAHTTIEIIEASGPLGIGAAMNAVAIAIFVEAIMVLAKMLERQQREEGRAQGIKEGRAQGVKEERKRSNAKLRAWAKENGIPEDKLPLDPEDE